MVKIAKRLQPLRKKIVLGKKYSLNEGLALLVESKSAKFDETVDVAIRLGVDATQGDQQVRGAVALPHGLGKPVRVLVFAQGEKAKLAEEAGADVVGGQDLAQKIEAGWLEFDQVIATPDMMAVVGKLGKILGPRGLMPNPKTGTVTMDVKRAVTECKSGKVEFKTDKGANVHAPIGKVSFGTDKIKDNLMALMETLQRLKPASSKGLFVRAVTVSNTMGPGIALDATEFGGAAS